MISKFTPALLTAVVLALAACGGDDSGGGNGGSATGATSAEESGATGGTATTGPGAGGGDGEAPTLDPDSNSEPVPKGSRPPEDRTGKASRYTRQKPIPKEQLKAADRPVFEQSRYLCRQLGLEAMRREYRIQSSDPQEVARAVARRTYLPESRDAVYSGCLAGLRSGN